MPDKHARFSPSAAGRWMGCPASLKLNEEIDEVYGKEKSSEAAQEGTDAHAFAAWLLGQWDPSGALKNRIAVDTELRESLQIYIDTVAAQMSILKNPELFIETKIGDPADDLFGTMDTLITHSDGVVIIDLKYGKRIYIPADSAQLKTYGYLAIEMLALQEGMLSLCVVQPRFIGEVHPVRWHHENIEDFRAGFAKELERACWAIRGEEDVEFVAGEHCTFCRAKPFCPRKQELLKKVLEADMNDPEQLKFVLDNASEVRSILEKANGLAIDGLSVGSLDPETLGYGLSKKVSNRQWEHVKGEEGLAPLLRRQGVDKEFVWVKKLISPAQAEKLGADKKWVAKYTKTEEGGLKLVSPKKSDPALIGAAAKDLAEFALPEDPRESKLSVGTGIGEIDEKGVLRVTTQPEEETTVPAIEYPVAKGQESIEDFEF